jgi:hypothetical protein
MDVRLGKHREFHEQFSGYKLSKEYFEKKERITHLIKHLNCLGETI